jgi:hypothetical protein
LPAQTGGPDGVFAQQAFSPGLCREFLCVPEFPGSPGVNDLCDRNAFTAQSPSRRLDFVAEPTLNPTAPPAQEVRARSNGSATLPQPLLRRTPEDDGTPPRDSSTFES